jgi:hypothetical protein
MDHESVVRQNMTESYLLGELEEEARQDFEEHFFQCPDCALDVRAGALFIEQSKLVLAERDEPLAAGAPVVKAAMPKAGWLAWLRPAFAAPVMALLLAVVGYQNLVVYPRLQSANRPQVLPALSLSVGAMGPGDQVISTGPGQGFVLSLRIPPDGCATHTVELYNPAGQKEWSLTFPALDVQNPWTTIEVPGAQRAPGGYRMKVFGLNGAGESKLAGEVTFDLQTRQ